MKPLTHRHFEMVFGALVIALALLIAAIFLWG